MKKSVSLKEFSTTPTVSYMLSKDGHNIAAALSGNDSTAPRVPAPAPLTEERHKPVPNDGGPDVMFDME
uniref:Uncharacterized protein n=1 Tax=Trypanosoma vivax (strain Y486) TaxID=1055687 RepID=G0TSZ3_TRYVY|nr:conserved hypothetical protein [Trypanosoma vivax Y486]